MKNIKKYQKVKRGLFTSLFLSMVAISNGLSAQENRLIHPGDTPTGIPEMISISTIKPVLLPPVQKNDVELETENFKAEWAFSSDQFSALEKVGFQWGDELVPKGNMKSDTVGFHDIYGWAKPFEIVRRPETGVLELVWENKESKAWNYRRIFSTSPEPLKVGDFYLVRFSFYDNLVNDEQQGGGGAWLSSQSIRAGNLTKEQAFKVSGFLPYKHKYLLFKINELNERFADRLHLHMNHEIAPHGIRLAYWSVRKLITGDSDGDGISDAEEILVLKDDPFGDLPIGEEKSHACCGGEDLHKEEQDRAGPRPGNPGGSGYVDYKLEWEKATVRLAGLEEEIRKEREKQAQQDLKITALGEDIANRMAEIRNTEEDLAKCQAMGAKLLAELSSKEKVLGELDNNIAQLVAKRQNLENEILQCNQELAELSAEYTKLEEEYAPLAAKLAVPHVKGWHYEAEQGWLYVEVGSYPYVFSERLDAWMYYKQGSHTPWEYFNYNTQSWTAWR